MHKTLITAAAALLAASTIHAQASVKVSIAVREVGVGLPYPGLGADGGFSGGIEWIDIDSQTLILDGTWQFFAFDLTTASITAFAGATANGILDGDWGTIEHIRVLNDGDVTERINLWVDEFENTTTPAGGSPTTATLQDFESFAAGDEVMFQEPCFSGSTNRHMFQFDPTATPPRCIADPRFVNDLSEVDATSGGAVGTLNSYKSTLRFLHPTPGGAHTAVTPGTRWMRLTSFQTINFANAVIPFNDQSLITFWMRGEVGSGVRKDGECAGVPHSLGGPNLDWTGSAALGDTLTLDGDTMFGSVCAMLIGTPINPGIPLGLVGGLAGSQLCVNAFASVPCAGQSTISLPLAIGNSPSLNGLTFAAQIADFDLTPVGTEPLPFGLSDTILFTPGNF